MKIIDLECWLVQAPRAGRRGPVRAVLLRLSTDSGHEGWGEASLPWRPQELEERRQWLLRSLAGRSVCDLADLADLDTLRQPALRSAVEMAAWDLIGRAARQPLCNLWGGAYRSRVPLAVRLVGDTREDLAAAAHETADTGIRVVIAPAVGRIDDDLDRLAAVLEAVNKHASVRADARGLFDSERAIDLASHSTAAGLEYLIDPVADAREGMAAVRRAARVPLAAARDVHAPADVLSHARQGAVALVDIDPARVGGPLAARECAAVAGAAGLAASCGGGPALGIATALRLQLAAATPAFNHAHESAYHELLDDVLTEPLEIVDGMFVTPQGPGLGVEVSRAKLERFQVG